MISGVRFNEDKLVMRINEYESAHWLTERVLTEDMDELTTWRFDVVDAATSDGGAGVGGAWKLDLGVNCARTRFHNRVLSVFAPFWMINKTGMHLTYRGSDQSNILEHPHHIMSEVPLMFSYITTKGIFSGGGKRKAALRIDNRCDLYLYVNVAMASA